MAGCLNEIIIAFDTQKHSISENGHFTSHWRGGLLAKASHIWPLKFTFPQRYGSGPQFCKRDFPKRSILIYQWCPLVGLIIAFSIGKNRFFTELAAKRQ